MIDWGYVSRDLHFNGEEEEEEEAAFNTIVR